MNSISPLHERISREQVAEVVHHFYQRAGDDEMLAPMFAAIHDWPQHEAFITDFWWGVMGGKVDSPRPGAMLTGHQGLGIDEAAMARWLHLFSESIEALVPTAEAQEWIAISKGIASMMKTHGLVS